MAVLHDFQCTVCDRVFDAVAEVIDDPASSTGTRVTCPPCPTDQQPTVRVFLPPTVTWTPDAVVVYRAPDGSFRYPGENAGTSTAKYDRMGYERIEARGFAEVRHLESRMNAHERSQLSRASERRLAQLEAADAHHRREARNGLDQGFMVPETRLVMKNGKEEVVHTGRRVLVQLSARSKDILRATMSRNDAKGHRRVGAPDIHVDAYSNSRGSRDESRRSDGKRYRD